MFVQNIVKDNIFFCLKWLDTMDLDCCNIYLDWLIVLRFNIPLNNIPVMSGLLLEGGRKKRRIG